MPWPHILHGYLATLVILTIVSFAYLALLLWRKP